MKMQIRGNCIFFIYRPFSNNTFMGFYTFGISIVQDLIDSFIMKIDLKTENLKYLTKFIKNSPLPCFKKPR